jgi:dihydropteroate synthase
MATGAQRFQDTLRFSSKLWMGILNVTPDSFSDGGTFVNPEKALKRAFELLQNGASILDIGGVSTRPGSQAPSAHEELARVQPLFQLLRQHVPSGVLLSVDTFQPLVAETLANQNLIDIVNDVYAGTFLNKDEQVSAQSTFEVAAKFKLACVMMHMRGTPMTMQLEPAYENCLEEVCQFLQERAHVARQCGVEALIVDPGIGFGKKLGHNLEILTPQGLGKLKAMGYPVLIGLSRKRFLWENHGASHPDLEQPLNRDPLSKQYENFCLQQGVQIIRSHMMPGEVSESSVPLDFC